MNRGRFFSSVTPVVAIVYAIVRFATGFDHTAVLVGAFGPDLAPKRRR